MTRYRQAIRNFRFRYFLACVLRHDGCVKDAAAEIGIGAQYIWEGLRCHGIRRADIREMLVNRELLRNGLPPRKPVASVGAAGAERRTA